MHRRRINRVAHCLLSRYRFVLKNRFDNRVFENRINNWMEWFVHCIPNFVLIF